VDKRDDAINHRDNNDWNHDQVTLPDTPTLGEVHERIKDERDKRVDEQEYKK
jgi:hypothetical protein